MYWTTFGPTTVAMKRVENSCQQPVTVTG